MYLREMLEMFAAALGITVELLQRDYVIRIVAQCHDEHWRVLLRSSKWIVSIHNEHRWIDIITL